MPTTQTVTRNLVMRLDGVTRRPGTKYLDCLCIATRIGVFVYQDPVTGETRREARLPEHVFEQASMDSAQNLPFTNDHPPVMLDSENTTQYLRGYFYGEISKVDATYLASRLLITDESTIRDYDAGKRDVSMGYKCVLVFKKGVFNGQEYDCIQTQIRYNHCSLVHRGRAGPTCRVRTDLAETLTVNVFDAIELIDQPQPQGVKRKMGSIRLDSGVQLEADDALAAAVNADLDNRRKNFDALKKHFDTMNGENASLVRENAQLKAQVAEFQKVDGRTLGKEWNAVEAKAKPFLGEKLDSVMNEAKAPVDVMRAALAAAHTDADYSKESDDFVRGCFSRLDARTAPGTVSTPSAAFQAGQGNAGNTRNDGQGAPAAAAAGPVVNPTALPPAGQQNLDADDDGLKAFNEMTGAQQ